MRRFPRMRWARAPLLHFVAGGAVLFVLVHGRAVRSPAPAQPVVVSAEDIAAIAATYTRETGLAATPADEAALVDDAIDEELLVREARRRGLDHDRSIQNWLVEQMRVMEGETADPATLYARAVALGLDRNDVVVRRILVHKMRLLAARTDEQPPSDAVLRAFFAAHADDYRAPARTSFWHVFIASSRNSPGPDAAAIADALRVRPEPPADAVRRGDPFVTSPYVRGWSPAQVAKVFGATFLAQLERTPERSWVGPIASPYGMHVVWVETREPGDVPPFETVRGRVRERWLENARAVRVADLLRALRRQTPLEIASSSWRQERGS